MHRSQLGCETPALRRMAVIGSPQPLPFVPCRRLQYKQKRWLVSLFCAVMLVFVPASAFHNNDGAQNLAFHSNRLSRRLHASHQRSNSKIVPEIGFHPAKEYVRVVMSVTNSPSIESDINSNIEELESLHKERQSITSSPNPQPEQSPPTPDTESVDKKLQQTPREPKQTLKSILHKPVGGLTESNLKRLCNAIRHSRKGQALYNLSILERILQELDHWGSHGHRGGRDRATFLKPYNVFSTLTGLSNDIKAWKRKQPRTRRISAQDIKRVVKVITLLSQQKADNGLDPGCYTKDVLSFATMISAEASRWEASAVDAALLFLGMLEKEEAEAEEQDPRLIGAVLDALARHGRAEEAQELLGWATGVAISTFDSKVSNEAGLSIAKSEISKTLDPSQAGFCYDALLRAWSERASLVANIAPDYSMKRRQDMERITEHSNKTSATASLDQARHILLNHMPVQTGLAITNRTCTAALKGFSSIGMASDSEKLLMELEALHLSPLYSLSSLESLSSSSTFLSSLDVACYNTVLHACSQSNDPDDVGIAERIFKAMNEQSPLRMFLTNSTINHSNNEDGALSSFISVIPPQPDLISYSSMINCLCKHGMVPKAEELLNGMHQNYTPNVACFLPVLQALDKSDDASAPDRVLSWIERSESSLPKKNRLLYIAALRCMKTHGRGDIGEAIVDKFLNAFPGRGGPDVYSYILVLRAWENTKPKTERQIAAKRAKIFFDKMEEMAKEYLLPALDVNAHNILLNIYARAGDAGEAEQFLAYMESTSGIHPTSKSYSFVIKALSNSEEEDAIDRAWQILHRLGFSRGRNDTLPPSKASPFYVAIDNFNAMLRLFSKRGMASEAESLLNSMDELVVEGVMKEGGPDIRSCEAVLEALGRCGDADAPMRAEALVTRLEVMSEMGGKFEPSLLAYNTLLNCYANAGMAGKAERLLERLNEPDSYSFGSTIKAIANSGKNEIVAMTRVKTLAEKLGTGNDIIFAHRLKLCSKFGLGAEAEKLLGQMEEQNLDPGVIHYTAALNAWAKSADDDATKRAEKLFTRMEDTSFELDLAAYHGLLLNYSVRGISKKARKTLQTVLDSHDIEPNRNSFTMAIDSYCRSKSNNAGVKAEELLDKMRELHAAGNPDVEPDNITYASVIRCKQVSAKKKINDLSDFEKIEIMRNLQMETWPFGLNE